MGEIGSSAAADRVALAARHPVPRVTLDVSLTAGCSVVHLVLAPSLLKFVASFTKAFSPSVESASPAPSPRSAVPTTPGTWQTSLPKSKSTEMRTPGSTLAEW